MFKKRIFKNLLCFSNLVTIGSLFISCGNKRVETQKEDIKENSDINKDKTEEKEVKSTLTNIENFSLIRIGHWNVLNQTGKSEWKNEAIAKIVQSQNMSLVGLTEITIDDETKEKAVSEIIKKLKEYEPNADWSYILSPKLFGKGRESQQEYIGIIYKNKLLEPIPFAGYNQNKNIYMGIPYENPEFISEFSGKKIVYARPPFGAKFRVKNDKKNDFTVIFSHFDSPSNSASKGEGKASGFSGQGEFEVSEALQLVEVLKWFDEKDETNDDIFFMGDTNIKTKNGAKAFAPSLKKGYKTLIDWDLKTSLGKRKKWSEPYDKMIYKGDIETSKADRFDIFKVFENGILNEKEWKNKLEQDGKNPKNDTLLDWVNKISDHTMTYVDLNVFNEDVDE
ncbi:endonuclease/exonuclease/phosphatase family protein [Mesomycoplasma molare]|uniref:Endonuclease/exonuclease/phosphatase family protein n=1 Tax=Mesomycoplasma molare TaxID=171288 RepID=A0ABY5TVK0_9BACT|nr:endonuclease/exonuclease/phosphatase family protein [Mesomycoplasma molare]UWD34364.1 endonuclease/exonuclease/phosphatase family protein [Mesomycoplasma molare]